MKSLRTDPEAARAVFETCAARLDTFGQELIDELAEAGHDRSELAWLFSQTTLASSVASFMDAGVPIEQLLDQIKKNWTLNNERVRHSLHSSTPRGQG